MSLDLIHVDTSRCIECGSCADVCSMAVLELGDHGPQAMQPLSCNSCGHCVAVCPVEALDHVNAPLAKQRSMPKNTTAPNPDSVAELLRSRRSVRHFHRKPISRETVEQILNVTRHAPMAMNKQVLSYHVFDDPKLLRAITEKFMTWAEEAAKHPSPVSGLLAARANAFRKNGRDGLLWSAPCLIVATAPRDLNALFGKTNASFALSYAQIYATALGLGTCWISGIDVCVSAGCEPVIKLLNLPENVAVAGTLVIGKPLRQYRRVVDRAPADITWAHC